MDTSTSSADDQAITTLISESEDDVRSSRHECDIITLYIKSTMRETFSIGLLSFEGFTTRDVYIGVSEDTSLSTTQFQLFFGDTKLPNEQVELENFNIVHNSTIMLHIGAQSPGALGPDVAKMSPARQAVRRHVFSMSPDEVSRFFGAESTVGVIIPDAHSGTFLSNWLFEIQLDTALYNEDDPLCYHASCRVSEKRETQMVRLTSCESIKKMFPYSVNYQSFFF